MRYESTDPWLLAFLKRVHSRPGMYLGDERVRTLATYLQGYGQAREDLGLPEFGDGEECLLDDFTSWLAKMLNDTRDVAWYTLIESTDASERNVNTFFQRLEEFLASRGQSLASHGKVLWPARDWRPPGL